MEIKLNNEFYYRVQQGDTFTTVSKKFNTDKNHILRNNPLIELYAGEMIKIKVLEYENYIVKPAQTLEEISKQTNIEESEIVALNNLKTKKLYIGQILKLPKKKG